MYKWHFPKEINPRRKGLGDAGIETFRGELVGSLVREIIQNSLDAKVEDQEKVVVEFNYFLLDKNSFPDKENFIQNLKESYDQSKKIKSIKQKEFFKEALNIFGDDKQKIPFLRISDFNTTGLTGSQSNGNSPWRDLVMSDGISTKSSEAGGSFGIGKSAPFACSKLNTVFYSTLDIENVAAHQGFAKLITVDKEDGYSTTGEGYYAKDSNKNPIANQANFDNAHNRTSPGTDIYIAGFMFEREQFDREAIVNTLNNYLYAIYDNKLEVNIGTISLTSRNLQQFVSKYHFYLDKETVEFMGLLVNNDASTFNDFDDGNQATLYLMIDEDGSRKISAIRKPWMKIKNFDGFSRGIQFKGAIIFHGSKVNKMLRNMENPAHNNWETDRISDPTKKNLSVQLLNNIKKYINDKILELQNLDYSDSLDLDGASNYIQLLDDESDKKPKKIIEKVSRVNVAKKAELTQEGTQVMQGYEGYVEEGGEEEKYDQPTTRGGGLELSDHPESTLTDIKKGKLISYKMKQVKLLKIGLGRYRLYYESDTNEALVHFQVFALSEEGSKVEYFNVVNAETDGEVLKTSKNYIRDVQILGGMVIVDFTIDTDVDFSLGVGIYETSK